MIKEGSIVKIKNERLFSNIEDSLTPLTGIVLKYVDENYNYPLIELANKKIERIDITKLEELNNDLIGTEIFITHDERWLEIENIKTYDGLQGHWVYVIDADENEYYVELIDLKHNFVEKQEKISKYSVFHFKRKQRRKVTAEDFTPPALVNEMLDRLPSEVFSDPFKTFCDPAAGNGNFLVEVLSRKLANHHPPLQALSTIWAVELMPDNVEEMKERLLGVLLKAHPELDDTQKQQAIEILNHNIIAHDALKWDFENWRSKERKAKALF